MKTRSPYVALAVSLVALALTACGKKDTSPPPPQTVDASESAPLPDAHTRARGLGSYSAMKARFEADCPQDLPSSSASSKPPYMRIDETTRSCSRLLAKSEARDRSDVERGVLVVHEIDEEQPYYPDVATPVVRVGVSYRWAPRKPVPLRCETVVDDAVGYAQDLFALSDQQSQRLAKLMRRQRADHVIARLSLKDREICLGGSVAIDDENAECWARVLTCDLVSPEARIVDVRLEDADNEPAASVDAGGPDGKP